MDPVSEPKRTQTSTHRFTRKSACLDGRGTTVCTNRRMHPMCVRTHHRLPQHPGARVASPPVMALDDVSARHVFGAGRTEHLSRWTYEPIEQDDALFVAAEREVVDGCRRIDNITADADRLGGAGAAVGVADLPNPMCLPSRT